MELTRALLLGIVVLTGYMLWNAWQTEYAKPMTPASTPISVQASQSGFKPVSALTQLATPTTTQPGVTPAQRFINIKTDVLDITIDTLGGNIVRGFLVAYPEQLHSAQPYQLFSDDPAKVYVAQSGLVGSNGPDSLQGQANYQVTSTDFQLKPGQDQLTVNLQWTDNKGLVVNKSFIFHRNNYVIDVNYQVTNHSSNAWTGQFYSQLERKKIPPPSHGMFALNPFVGGAISTDTKPYEKLSFSKLSEENINQPVTNGWVAMMEHYFLSAWVPPANQTFNYYSHADNNNEIYTLGMLSSPATVKPGEQYQTGAKLYAGPEVIDNLKTVAPNLDLTIDYSFLWFVAIPIFWLLKHIYNIVGNWGWSIVLVTVIIKLLFYHLSAKSYRSMASMKKLQPRLQLLRERFTDDKQKLTQATMELYRSEKINPLSGCLPIVVQIPVFIALYWVLLASVELRQAPFILWIHDLSAPDPYYILPFIMGFTMFLQQKLNPPPADPTQAKMMQFLPLFFIFIFLKFPSGLVLYWIVNNTLSILQQWYIMRSVQGNPVVRKKKNA